MYGLTSNFDLMVSVFYRTGCQCFVKFHLAHLICLVFLFLLPSGVLGLFIFLIRPKKLSLHSEYLVMLFYVVVSGGFALLSSLSLT